MNSSYGKTCQKPILSEKKYLKYQTYKYLDKKQIQKLDSAPCDKSGHKILNGHVIYVDGADGHSTNGRDNNKPYYQDYPLNKFLIKNGDKIVDINKISKNLREVKVAKAIEEYANNNLLGVMILDMSKRIMNEVMTLAEYEGIKIFYQDTDSMHIEKSKLKELEEAYKQKYGRDLIGADMGQFHSDFDELTGDVYATKSIFLGKKAYIDLLENDRGEHSVHYRMKGIPLECIKYHALMHYTKLSLNEYKALRLKRSLVDFKSNSMVLSLYKSEYNFHNASILIFVLSFFGNDLYSFKDNLV